MILRIKKEAFQDKSECKLKNEKIENCFNDNRKSYYFILVFYF